MEIILQHILGGLPPEQVEGLDLDARYLADMGFDPIDHFGGLAPFTQLRELSVAGQNIDSWDGLESVSQLEELDLSDNELDSLRGAPNLPELIHLDLSLNQIRSLELIPDWPALKTLNIGHNQLTSLDGLEALSLESLTISGNKALSSLDMLPGLQDLTHCFATRLLVPDWSWVKESSLEVLSFSPTASHRITHLGSCATLRQLSVNLSRCTGDIRFPSLPSLDKLSITKGKGVGQIVLPEAPLSSVSLTFCGLDSVPPIPDSSALHTLDLRFNELTKLPDLSSFPALKDVYLEGNPLGLDVKKQMDVRPSIRWHL